MFVAPKIFLLMQMKIIRGSASGQVGKEWLCAAGTAAGWGEAAVGRQVWTLAEGSRVASPSEQGGSRVSTELLISQYVGFLLIDLCNVSKEQSTVNTLLSVYNIIYYNNNDSIEGGEIIEQTQSNQEIAHKNRKRNIIYFCRVMLSGQRRVCKYITS